MAAETRTDLLVAAAHRLGQVPRFRVDLYRGRQTRYAVAVFVLNEGERIRAQLQRMRPWASVADIIIADGGSSDGALEPRYLEEAGVASLLTKEGPGRLSAQMRMALAFALASGYEGVITIDGNGKDDPAAIPRFIEAMDAGVHHVQGSRFRPGGQALNTPPARWLGVRLVHAPLISLAARFRYTDTTNGFRAYRRELLLDPRVQPFRDVFSDYELHYYLSIRAPELGFNTAEVPVTRAYPKGKPAPTKITPLAGNLRVLRTLARACMRRYHPAAGADGRLERSRS